ncbi:MAG TPA: phenylalanine--tRNA ligase subunit beta [Phycisphaerales bacterium]|nr:phenylalanine--tRNA ligase subunit beta [Phycisphaerales bacterium]
MKLSLRWLHEYLTGPLPSAEAAERALMALGFPSESLEQVQTVLGPDTCIDLEVTSNRGDCLSHVGVARELAASGLGVSNRDPAPVEARRGAQPASGALTLRNEAGEGCPLFLAKVIRGVRVGESPPWVKAKLEACGQRPINNVVDVTNFVALELGNPCHAFDLARLAGPGLVVRTAHKGEKLTTLDGKARTLAGDELVVADTERAQGLAGVMGGQDSEVGASTTDVVLEVATWDPVRVRNAARRHGLRTTASHRYERIVDARTLEFAAERAAALIASLSGGEVLAGTLSAGEAPAAAATVRLRPERMRAILGFDVPTDRAARHLRAVGVGVGPLGRGGDDLLCTIPAWRPDLTREIDLVEEVARVEGLDAVPVRETISVRASAPQATEAARRAIAGALTGMGFFETVTFSFTSPARAELFMPAGLSTLGVDDERRGDEPSLRPSVLAGLLSCRAANQHAGVVRPGGVRLFESASVFAQDGRGGAVENTNLGLLLDAPPAGRSADRRAGVRLMRGAIESVARATAGATLSFEPSPPHAPAFEAAAFARVAMNGAALGYMGLLSKQALSAFGLEGAVVGAELNLAALIAAYPPASRVVLPPQFPAIERDVSLVVDDSVRWAAIDGALTRLRTGNAEAHEFVATYRGKPLPGGKKSVTVRLRFRDPARTLTHDEVDGPVAEILAGLKKEVPFELRA